MTVVEDLIRESHDQKIVCVEDGSSSIKSHVPEAFMHCVKGL